MNSVALHKIVVALLGVLLLGICISIGLVLFQTNRELQVLREREVAYRQELAEKNDLYQERHAYLKKLLNDPAFFEKVVRERLGYSREDEIIFRFPEN